MAELRGDIEVREVGQLDLRGIFELSNHPSVRDASFRGAPISWQEHVRWFAAMMRDPLCGFYVAESEGRIAGQVRFRQEGARTIVSISIAPCFRGRGVGAELYRRALAAFRSHHHASEVVARIKERNTEAIAFFRKLGFVFAATEWIGGEEAVVMVSDPRQVESRA